MSILFGLLLFVVFVLFGIIAIGANFLHTLFRGPRRNSAPRTDAPTQTTEKPHQKIFTKDEGEYVDFEEVDDK